MHLCGTEHAGTCFRQYNTLFCKITFNMLPKIFMVYGTHVLPAFLLLWFNYLFFVMIARHSFCQRWNRVEKQCVVIDRLFNTRKITMNFNSGISINLRSKT